MPLSRRLAGMAEGAKRNRRRRYLREPAFSFTFWLFASTVFSAHGAGGAVVKTEPPALHVRNKPITFPVQRAEKLAIQVQAPACCS